MTNCRPEDWPSVETVYPLALESYQTAVKRFDAVDAKLNNLLTLAVSVSLAIPVIAHNKGLSFNSPYFYLAILAFAAGIAVATFARFNGHLHLLDPAVLYNYYLDLEPWQFKRHSIDWAGKNWTHNQNLINRNGKFASLTAVLFALEVVFVALWVKASAI